jgi:hypothetical protein
MTDEIDTHARIWNELRQRRWHKRTPFRTKLLALQRLLQLECNKLENVLSGAPRVAAAVYLELDQLAVLLPDRERQLFDWVMGGRDVRDFPAPPQKRQASLGRLRKRIAEYCRRNSLERFERSLVGYRCRRLNAELALEPLRVFVPVLWAASRPHIILENMHEYLICRRRAQKRQQQWAAEAAA